MIDLEPYEYDAFTRLDFWVFVQRVFAELDGGQFLDNFHIQLICAELEAVRMGDVHRLAIALPPRSLKSIIVSVALPAWLLGQAPQTRIICASYGQDLANKLATDCRQVMRSGWYRRLFPAAILKADRQALDGFETTAGGGRLATSVGGALTGFGADVIIVDDPVKPEEAFSEATRSSANDWARHTLFTRLNDKSTGRIIIVMQRLHEDDMIGHVMQIADFKLLSFSAIAQQDEKHVIRTPFGDLHARRSEGEALHPAREPLEVLAHQKQVMGSRFFAAQYLQMPSPPDGGLVKAHWFGRYDIGRSPEFIQIVQSWDTANKGSVQSDFSVCTTWGRLGDQAYLMDVWRQRVDYPELKRAVRNHAERYKADAVLIEDSASGVQLAQELKQEGFWKIYSIKPKGDKVSRFERQTAVVEAGKVFIPYTSPWLEDYAHELLVFPNGRHDDQVDSTSQALAFIFERTGVDAFLYDFQKQKAEAVDRSKINIPVRFLGEGNTLYLRNGRRVSIPADRCILVSEEEIADHPVSIFERV